MTADLSLLRTLGATLRAAEWAVTALVELDTWQQPQGPARLLDLWPGTPPARLCGAAIDIGTTSNVVYLVDLADGKVVAAPWTTTGRSPGAKM
ncbi:MAG: hypothetical protein R2854_09070 [Caldilineaceae bacterium]